MGISGQWVIQTLVYGFVFWFALYLLHRSTERKLLYTGLGLGAYAIALAFDLFSQIPIPENNTLFLRLHWGVLILPAVFWTGATLQLLPDPHPLKERAHQIWHRGILPAGLIISLLYPFPRFLWHRTEQTPTLTGYLLFLAMSMLPLLTGLWVIQTEIRQWQPTQKEKGAVQDFPKKGMGGGPSPALPFCSGLLNSFTTHPKEKRRSIGLILTAALFFALGSGIAIFQMGSTWLSHSWVLLAIGIDLEILGFAIAYLDAFEQGETLWPDFLRSLASSALIALLFGGQVAFVIAISTGITLPMMILLLTTLSIAIFTQVFADPIQDRLDRLVFARFPRLRQERADSRGVTAAVPRTTASLSPLALDEAEFTRFTRRALSHFGDLPKLASNPLTHLPLLETRLTARTTPINTLARATELKRLLAESVDRLKPTAGEPFGTSDAWRFYNALYYPYILGLRPYSRRAPSPQDKEIQTILAWFRSTVPERTLHNWQNTAATLIAKDLREQ